jgi:hypothetical protein
VSGYTRISLREVEDVARERDMPDEMSVRFPGAPASGSVAARDDATVEPGWWPDQAA